MVISDSLKAHKKLSAIMIIFVGDNDWRGLKFRLWYVLYRAKRKDPSLVSHIIPMTDNTI